MIFYFAPHTCSLASHIALEYVGATYELRKISFESSQQSSPEYLRVNPKGRVPALVTDRGTLTETPAILAFIAQSFPASKIAPIDDPFRFAEVQAFNSYLCATVHVAHAHRMRGYRWADDEVAIEAMKMKVPVSVGECFRTIEKAMFPGPWVFGDSYTISDMYLFTFAQWLEADGVDVEFLPTVAAHRERMQNDPVVKRAISMELDTKC